MSCFSCLLLCPTAMHDYGHPFAPGVLARYLHDTLKASLEVSNSCGVIETLMYGCELGPVDKIPLRHLGSACRATAGRSQSTPAQQQGHKQTLYQLSPRNRVQCRSVLVMFPECLQMMSWKHRTNKHRFCRLS